MIHHKPSNASIINGDCKAFTAPTPEVPVAGAQILAKVPDDLKDSSFFENYAGDYYPAQVLCPPFPLHLSAPITLAHTTITGRLRRRRLICGATRKRSRLPKMYVFPSKVHPCGNFGIASPC